MRTFLQSKTKVFQAKQKVEELILEEGLTVSEISWLLEILKLAGKEEVASNEEI